MDRILQCGDVIMDMNQMCAALCVHRWLHWLHWASNQPGLAIAGLVPGPDSLFPTSRSSARLDQLQTLQTTLYSHYGKQSALILVIRAQLSANHTAVNICFTRKWCAVITSFTRNRLKEPTEFRVCCIHYCVVHVLWLPEMMQEVLQLNFALRG